MSIKILIAAGGTGGHIFPALAVAKELQARGVKVAWLVSDGGMEARIAKQANIQTYSTKVKGIRGKGKLKLLFAPFNLVRWLWQALLVLRASKPDLVLGMGGFVAGPIGLAAWLSGVHLCIHEQNAIPGFTNKLLARFADRVMLSFKETKLAGQTVHTGNPIRREIVEQAKLMVLPQAQSVLTDKIGSNKKEFNILVLGGSLGAASLNRAIPKTIEHLLQLLQMKKRALKINVWHQTGQHLYAETRDFYGKLAINSTITPFIEDMASAYAFADLVIARAGATTIAEISEVGLPSILVPYPLAVNDHQTYNAKALQQQDAAICLPEQQLKPEKLAKCLYKFIFDQELLAKLRVNSKCALKSDATNIIVEQCMQVIDSA